MNQKKIEKMQDRATRRRDWVFSTWPYQLYAVLNNKLVWFSEFVWPEAYDIYQLSIWFAVKVWEAENKNQARKKLEYLIFNIEN